MHDPVLCDFGANDGRGMKEYLRSLVGIEFNLNPENPSGCRRGFRPRSELLQSRDQPAPTALAGVRTGVGFQRRIRLQFALHGEDGGVAERNGKGCESYGTKVHDLPIQYRLSPVRIYSFPCEATMEERQGYSPISILDRILSSSVAARTTTSPSALIQ